MVKTELRIIRGQAVMKQLNDIRREIKYKRFKIETSHPQLGSSWVEIETAKGSVVIEEIITHSKSGPPNLHGSEGWEVRVKDDKNKKLIVEFFKKEYWTDNIKPSYLCRIESMAND